MKLVERFEKYIAHEPNTGCWLWTGAMTKSGYGRFIVSIPGSKAITKRAHRVSFELYKNKIPNGMFVLHKCDIPACVNPDHLFLGTHTDNIRDSVKKKRNFNSKKTHCKKGHEFSEKNTLNYRGHRLCIKCTRKIKINYMR